MWFYDFECRATQKTNIEYVTHLDTMKYGNNGNTSGNVNIFTGWFIVRIATSLDDYLDGSLRSLNRHSRAQW